jgi:hypothetical protein
MTARGALPPVCPPLFDGASPSGPAGPSLPVHDHGLGRAHARPKEVWA